MSRIHRNFILIVAISFLFSGCFSVHTGMITGTANLTANNFTIVARDVRGSAQTFMFAGFGGWSVDGLVYEAKKNLLKHHELKSNQALANVTVDFKTSVYLVLGITKECFITADIVEFK